MFHPEKDQIGVMLVSTMLLLLPDVQTHRSYDPLKMYVEIEK